MAQAERELRRKITGNVSLYLFLDRHRQRSFLRRNIEKVLKYHADWERSGRRAVLPTNGATITPPTMVDKCRQGIPDREIDVVMAEDTPTPVAVNDEGIWAQKRGKALDEIVGKIKLNSIGDNLPERVLRIEVRSLKRKRVVGEQDSKSTKQPPSKRMKSMLASCCCELQILGKCLHDESMELLIQDRQPCSVSRVLGGDGDMIAEIDLEEGSFFVKANRLLDKVQRGSKPVQIRRDCYTVKISLTSTGPPDWLPELVEPGPPLSRTESRHPKHLISASGDLSFLRDGVLLDMGPASSTGGLRTKTTEFGIEVMVTASNPLTRKLRKVSARKPSSDIERNPVPKAQVKYLISATKTQKLMGYCCNMCERREFHTMELLHFHLLTCHDYFKYKVSEGRRQEGRARWKIHLDVADYKGFDDEDEDEKVVWVRPRRPFKLSKYLRGDDSWITGRTPLSTPPPAPPQLSRSTSSARNSQTRQATGSPTIIDPNAVPDLPKPRTRKFAVPPGGRYYRSLTKRRLKPGEMLSESDDDVDESWLIQKHKETIDDFADVFLAEKTFMKHFDEHMLRENLCAQRYVPSALIRFCRTNREWLNATDMLVEFWKQCLYLTQHGIINAAHVKACMDIIQGTNGAGRSKVRLGDSLPKLAMGAHGDLHPGRKAAQSIGHRRSTQDPFSSEMDVDDSFGTDEEQIVHTIIHGDVQPDDIQQVPIRTLPPQQQANPTSTAAGDSGYAIGEYVNTEVCHGGCGEWKRSNLIICEERVSHSFSSIT
jgi:VEFS-Box of polycomb protein